MMPWLKNSTRTSRPSFPSLSAFHFTSFYYDYEASGKRCVHCKFNWMCILGTQTMTGLIACVEGSTTV